jgi:hypothetical protein
MTWIIDCLAPGEVQLTLFEELETLDERSQRPGFQSD